MNGNACRIGMVLAAAVLVLAAMKTATAQESACPLPNQRPMLVVQLFFGLDVEGRGPVTPREWRGFLRHTVTPRFPDGLTVYDGYGQWLSPKTGTIAHINSKVIIIATQDTEEVRKKIIEVTDVYRNDFHQHSVGVLTSSACGAF